MERRSTELDPTSRSLTRAMLEGVERLVRRGPVRRAMQDVLRSLEVVDAIRTGGEAFALGYLSVPDEWLPERHVAVLTSFVRHGRGWRVTGMTSDGYATSRRNTFDAGTHLCGTIPLSTPDRTSAIAAVDPTVTRMEVGRSLVDALLAGEVEVLGLHIHRSITLSISAVAEVVHEGSWELGTSQPAREPGWVRYVVNADGTVGTIGVRFYRESRTWFITAVDLRVGG